MVDILIDVKDLDGFVDALRNRGIDMQAASRKTAYLQSVFQSVFQDPREITADELGKRVVFFPMNAKDSNGPLEYWQSSANAEAAIDRLCMESEVTDRPRLYLLPDELVTSTQTTNNERLFRCLTTKVVVEEEMV
jgi:hypothetical protein